MVSTQAAGLKIGGMFLVILAGWAMARRGYLAPEITRALSRVVVSVAFPALVFTQMLRTVDTATLGESGWVPLLALVTLGISLTVAWAAARLGVPPADRPTVTFAAAVPNWIYFPLPIAEATHGPEGVRFVVLFNVGAQFFLWTAGPLVLRGRVGPRETVRGLALNPGILAAAAGVALALAWPPARALLGAAHGPGAGRLAAAAFLDALSMLGSLTIPLSLLVTGAQLGGLNLSERAPAGVTAATVATRLLAAPLVLIALWRAADRLIPVRLADADRDLTLLIMAMPPAVTVSLFVEHFGGNRALAGRTIVIGTLAGVATVPALLALARWIGP